MVEKERVGGCCTWMGCVPSKALIKAAGIAHAARTAADYGVQTGDVQVDMGKVRDYVHRAIHDVYRWETPETLAEEGIDVVMGAARFTNPHTIQVGAASLTASRFILATGAVPFIPPIPGLDQVPHFTYRHFFDNDRLPEHLLVIGAGSIGVELAQAYRRLGSRVTIVDEILLPQAEFEVRQFIGQIFAAEDIDYIPGLVSAAMPSDDDIVLHVADRTLQGDMVLVAAGRSPSVQGLALEQAGVAVGQQGIQVDDKLRTSAKHIYAAGDCAGGPQFTHYAGWQGFQAARNALLPGQSSGVADHVPWALFTDPEIAHAGLTEAEARAIHGNTIQVTRWDGDHMDRAVADQTQSGYIKVVHKTDGAILGATVVSSRAGEVITEFILSMQHNLSLRAVAEAIHVYPTYTFPVQRLAADVATEQFLHSFIGKVAKRLAGFK